MTRHNIYLLLDLFGFALSIYDYQIYIVAEKGTAVIRSALAHHITEIHAVRTTLCTTLKYTVSVTRRVTFE